MAGEMVGSVEMLWCYPVKSLGGTQEGSATVTERGFQGDRAYALVDADQGTVISAKNPRRWPGLLDWQASFEMPESSDVLPGVRITTPDGVVLSSQQADVDDRLSERLGRRVRLSSQPPASPMLEQYHPESDAVTEEMLPAGTFFDLAPLHLLTTATIRHLQSYLPHADLNVRRFRPNIVIRSEEMGSGFIEDAWVGATLQLGNTVRIQVTARSSRCVMTTLPQPGLPPSAAVLQAAAKQNDGCVGVYARILQGGVLRQGDVVQRL